MPANCASICAAHQHQQTQREGAACQRSACQRSSTCSKHFNWRWRDSPELPGSVIETVSSPSWRMVQQLQCDGEVMTRPCALHHRRWRGESGGMRVVGTCHRHRRHCLCALQGVRRHHDGARERMLLLFAWVGRGVSDGGVGWSGVGGCVHDCCGRNQM